MRNRRLIFMGVIGAAAFTVAAAFLYWHETRRLEATRFLRQLCRKDGLKSSTTQAVSAITIEFAGLEKVIPQERLYWAHNFAPKGFPVDAETDFGNLRIIHNTRLYVYPVTSSAGVLYIRTFQESGSGVLELKKAVLLGESPY